MFREFIDFEFNGKRLSSFDGIIVRDTIEHKMDVFSMNVKYNKYSGSITNIKLNPFYFDMQCLFTNIDSDKMHEIKKWLYAEEPKCFRFVGDNKSAWCLLKVNTNMHFRFNNSTTILNLECCLLDPLWDLDFEKILITEVNKKYIFNCPGTHIAYPDIHIKADGDVKFKVNDDIFEIKNITIDCDIESRKRLVYTKVADDKLSKRMDFKCLGKREYLFPTFEVGKNTFEIIEGNISKTIINVNPRTI